MTSFRHAGVCGSGQTCDFTPPFFSAPLLPCAYQLENAVSLHSVLRLNAVYSSVATQTPENRLNNKWPVCIWLTLKLVFSL